MKLQIIFWPIHAGFEKKRQDFHDRAFSISGQRINSFAMIYGKNTDKKGHCMCDSEWILRLIQDTVH